MAIPRMQSRGPSRPLAVKPVHRTISRNQKRCPNLQRLLPCDKKLNFWINKVINLSNSGQQSYFENIEVENGRDEKNACVASVGSFCLFLPHMQTCFCATIS